MVLTSVTCKRDTISRGVAAGATMPNQVSASKPLRPGTPDSATVGMSGSSGERLAEPTASARILPLLMCGTEVSTLSYIKSVCPPIKSISAGAAPLYGMCKKFTLAMLFNISMPRCVTEPAPEVPKLNFPGLALPSAISSVRLRAGTDGCTTTTKPTADTMVMGAKSFSES